jgi:predicted nucleotidyltransferase component of viral defense system
MTKNAAKSIKAKLLNIARNKQLDYQLLLIRYLYERFLYRLSISKYRGTFCLKGGALLYAFAKEFPRPTLDIDFLGIKIKNDMDTIQHVFAEILTLGCEDDGVDFEIETIKVEEISESKTYQGIRLTHTAHLDSIKQIMKTDIGFGDIITPAARDLSYPTLLQELPAPNILAYSLETVVAEKFQAMIDLSEVNSRYKDFYDVYKILETQELDEMVLGEAVHATFKNRQTMYQDKHPLFTHAFAKDTNRNTQWKRFLKKMKQDEDLSFETTMSLITSKLQPVFETLKA